ncbi:hypothetical protein B0E47_09295 [Rhodanobacter sp. B05]|uniref:hypothetical protein n=1 Tax=Rhodanobacter sp. B05 TaxID=1945859 RepID=UPI0009878F26|nr:hypothetical protein [Rhodanobacter sp. B05]OOG55012.1 hypothetical protein B0E47_09295 [Rhodanobacter sp. B05]
MPSRNRLAAPPAMLCLALLPMPGHATSFCHLGSTATLPGKAPAWDYPTCDAARSRQSIGRRHDGGDVFDATTLTLVATTAGPEGANKVIQVPQLDRRFSVNGDSTGTESEYRDGAVLPELPFDRTFTMLTH